ncbi:Trm112 family protein [Actinopolymorpha rutila]|uniref:UPF0434 protein F4554_004279 n=1 Tax=Actinopolymorpha rutila TaxID=446787 RepID=A0A852ZEN3_9ACTN|nr:uncharacterized protein YbaR (Trm112 family) [Actinopolymorpha rutila]
MNLNPALLEILACPACRSPLHPDDAASELVCTNAACGLAYPVRDDIPVLLVDEARRPDSGASASAGESGSDAGPTDGNSPTATDA